MRAVGKLAQAKNTASKCTLVVWGRQFDDKMTDSFDLCQEIAEK
jgi:TolB-like protein